MSSLLSAVSEWLLSYFGVNIGQAVIGQFAISLTRSVMQAHLSEKTSSTQSSRGRTKNRCCSHLVRHEPKLARQHALTKRPNQNCYCRFRLSRPMPTIHPLPKHVNQAKENNGVSYSVSLPGTDWLTHLQTPYRRAERRSLPLHLWALHHISPRVSPGRNGSAVRSTEGGGSWLAGSSHFKYKYPGMELGCVHARWLTHPCTHPDIHISVVHAHAHNVHKLRNTHFSCVPASLCRDVRFIHGHARNINSKREALLKQPTSVFKTPVSSRGGVHFKVGKPGNTSLFKASNCTPLKLWKATICSNMTNVSWEMSLNDRSDYKTP